MYHCDAPVGDGPYTIVTGADTAPGTPERPGAGANQEPAQPVTWRSRGGSRRSGALKTPMSMEDRRGGKEEEEDEVVEEPCLSWKTEEDKEVAAEERSTEAAPGGRAKDSATLLEKLGTTRLLGGACGKEQDKATNAPGVATLLLKRGWSLRRTPPAPLSGLRSRPRLHLSLGAALDVFSSVLIRRTPESRILVKTCTFIAMEWFPFQVGVSKRMFLLKRGLSELRVTVDVRSFDFNVNYICFDQRKRK
ncbi:hypothetical protein NDU88_008285 [Pleurodeles waltl]|uniref:Uncharacterized protein n=1 Tax=Pleurodeles waltl TaxID=8319 RepID=A0AAV7P4M4_PLEWA|nr:hypothetical protein NDU88_008285 [Pleurodeles waltl]